MSCEFSALPLSVNLVMEFSDELGDEVGRHQLVLESAEDQALDDTAAHAAAVVAGAHAPCVAAGDMIGADRCQGATAGAAEGFFGQQMPGSAMFPEPARPRLLYPLALANAAKALLHGIPQGLGNDPQLRNLFDHPCAGWIEPRAPLAARRVLKVAQPVPHQPANIEFVAQDAGAARVMASDGAVAPRTAPGPGTPSPFKMWAIARGLSP